MQWLLVQTRIQDVNVDHVRLAMLAMGSTVRNNHYVIRITADALQWQHAQKAEVRSLANVVRGTLAMALVQMVASKLISHVT